MFNTEHILITSANIFWANSTYKEKKLCSVPWGTPRRVRGGSLHTRNSNNFDRKQATIITDPQAKCCGILRKGEIRESEVSWRWDDLNWALKIYSYHLINRIYFLPHSHLYHNSPLSERCTQSKMNDIRISHWLITWHKVLFDPEKLSRNNFWSYFERDSKCMSFYWELIQL